MAEIYIDAHENRLLPVSASDLVTGEPVDISGMQVDIALTPYEVRPQSSDWITVLWSDLPGNVVLPLGFPNAPGWDLNVLGAGYFYPRGRLHDGSELLINVGETALRIRND